MALHGWDEPVLPPEGFDSALETLRYAAKLSDWWHLGGGRRKLTLDQLEATLTEQIEAAILLLMERQPLPNPNRPA